MATITNEHRALAQTTLQVLLTVQLPAEQWQEVETELQKLHRALEQDNADAFRQARKALEQLTQPRIGRIGGEPKTTVQPPSDRTRDLINRMVDTLQLQGERKSPDQKPPAGQSDEGR